MAHVLIVGGTGMLNAVSCFLAEKGNIVTVIARNRDKLHEMSCKVAALGGKINPLSVDYNNLEDLENKLSAAVGTYGPIQLAVAWMLPRSRPTFYHLANFLNRTSPVCRLFQVCNTDWIDFFNHSDEVESTLSPLSRVYYRKILLGRMDETVPPRWLNHEEISSGIIDALSQDARLHVIGRIEPLAGQVLSA